MLYPPYFWERLHSSLLMAAFILLGLISIANAGQQVVRFQLSDNATAFDTDLSSENRNEIFTRAVLKEASELLPEKLSPQREEVLSTFIRKELNKFVLSYSEQEHLQEAGRKEWVFRVDVNEWSLKNFLKDWGIYYTAGSIWKYSLSAQGLDTKGWEQLQRLELLSGLRRKNQGLPELVLRRDSSEKSFWHASLQAEEEKWTYYSKDLSKIWKHLWSKYFELPGIKSKVLQTLYIKVENWPALTGLKAFDQRLSKWNVVSEKPELLTMEVESSGVQGYWKVTVIDAVQFKNLLGNYLSPRGLEYKLLEQKEGTKEE